MPLPTPQQVLPQPVSNYYQGRALRLNEQMAQKDLEQADERLDLEKQRVALSERNTATSEGALEQRITEYADRVGKERVVEEANTIMAITAGAKSVLDNGGSPEDSIAYANKQLSSFIDAMPDGENKDSLKKMAEDGFQAEELAQLQAGAMATHGIFPTDDNGEPSIKPTAKMIEAASMGFSPGSEEWKDYLRGGKSEKPATTKPIPPPTRAEADIVDEVVGKIIDSDKYDDYGFDNQSEDHMRRWLADTTERIQRLHAQRNRSLGYAEAADMAAIEMEKFIKAPPDPGFFSQDDYKFDYPAYQIGDIIAGEDGRQYLVTGYNEKGGPRGEPIGN